MPTNKTIRLIKRHNKLPAVGLSALAYGNYAIRLEIGAKREPDEFAAECLRMRAANCRSRVDVARSRALGVR